MDGKEVESRLGGSRLMDDWASSRTLIGMSKRTVLALVSALGALVLGLGFLVTGAAGGGAASAGVANGQALMKLCSEGGTIDYGDSRYMLCVAKHFEEVSDSTGISAAVQQMSTWSDQTGGLGGLCHNIAHDLGQWAFNKYGMKSVEADMNACGYGYGHGVMEAAGKILDADEIAKKFSNVCSKNLSEEGCIHGFGHSIANAGLSAEAAGKVCAGLPPRPQGVKSSEFTCMQGWAMNHADLIVGDMVGETDMAKSYKQCVGISGQSLVSCQVSFISSWVTAPFVSSANQNVAASEERIEQFVQFCKKYTEGADVLGCKSSLGHAVSQVEFFYATPEQAGPTIARMCSGDGAQTCIEQVVASKWARTGADPVKLLPLCEYLPSEFRESCNTLMETVKTW